MTVETYKIFGPPGTGKTTRMLKLIEEEIDSGVEPSEICYISFTRAAVAEARNRAMSKFSGLDIEKDLAYFRTMHSLAYRVLGLGRDRIMAGTPLFEFGERSGYRFDAKTQGKYIDIEDVMLGDSAGEVSLGSYLLSIWDYIRNKKWGLDEGIKLYSQPIFHNEITGRSDLVFKDFVMQYERCKQENNLLDFSDMLLRVKRFGQPLWPSVKAVFADEVQDFSPLQWDVLHVWANPAYNDNLRLYLAGDDDQAIFTFQSATPELFLQHSGVERVLARSWRLTSQVWDYSQKMITKNQNRREKKFSYHKEGGQVDRVNGLSDLVPAIKNSVSDDSGGSWFILGRNRYLLDRVAGQLEENFIPFVNRRGSSAFDSKKLIKACEIAVRLSQGGQLTMSELNQLVQDYVDSQHILYDGLVKKTYVIRGAKKQIEEQAKASPNHPLTRFDIGVLGVTQDFFEALDTSPLSVIKFSKPAQREYILGAYDKFGQGVFQAASKIAIGTIHSAKGAEADNVALLSDVSNSCFKNIQTDPEGERRVFYVGATRAKQNLYLVRPQTSKFYPL